MSAVVETAASAKPVSLLSNFVRMEENAAFSVSQPRVDSVKW